MKKLLFTLALGLASTLATAQDSTWSATFNGVYAKPFLSNGYASRSTDGYGLNASLESRCRPWLGVGLNAHGLGFRQAGRSSSFSGFGVFARVLPFNTQILEPYALLGLGADYGSGADSLSMKRDPGVVLQGGLGALLPLGSCLAVDFGVDYVSRPGGQVLQQAQGRLGLQLRFGQAQSLGQAPRAQAESGELQTVSLAKGKAKSTAVTATTSSTSVAAAEDKRYLVKRGDNLWRIAAQDSVYGNPYKYKKLVEANSELIKDPNLIYPDTKLVLP